MQRWCLGFALLLVASAVMPPVAAQEDGPMNNARLDKLIRQIEGIEGEIKGRPGFWQFKYQGRQTYVITDERADRMRIMSPVTAAEGLSKDALFRAMQANFDTALDARYAIAKGALWSAFIHPLSPLDDAEFHSALAQVVTLASTYGTTYNSSGLRFGGGDSPPGGKPKSNGKGKGKGKTL
jgi:hypothetical protein